ncbi:MAG: Gx transporter family protein [Lachnospiraceae bacterium]|nr:Gx transporter family protein [Lachnospiraceae bacterium]
MQSQTRKTAVLGLFIALALIFSYVESVIPVPLVVPGAKLGLPNTLVLLLLYVYGVREAMLVNVTRILLSGFMFGNLFSILYSLAGAIFSFVFMVFAKRTRIFSMKAVSILGGVFHNIGQIIVAAFLVSGISVMAYLPVLIVVGVVTGLCNGVLAEIIYKRGIL